MIDPCWSHWNYGLPRKIERELPEGRDPGEDDPHTTSEDEIRRAKVTNPRVKPFTGTGAAEPFVQESFHVKIWVHVLKSPKKCLSLLVTAILSLFCVCMGETTLMAETARGAKTCYTSWTSRAICW
jgi:hypothetical protein